MTTSIANDLRVLELGSGLSGALAGMVLADNGAEVVRVEPPDGDPYQTHAAFRMWNRGKTRVAADLRDAFDRAAIRALAEGADVLLSSWKPGTSERFGLDADSLEPANPRLVHCEISGFGSSGPFAHLPAYDGIVAARAGRMYEFSTLEAGRRPAYAAVPVGGYGAGMLALQGIFSALYERERSGRGQRVRTSLLQALTVFDMINWLPGGPPPLRIEDAPDLGYLPACTRDGRWVQFAQRSPRQFTAMVRTLGLEEAVRSDPRFEKAPVFASAEDACALREIMLRRMREKSFDEWMEIFDADSDLSVVPFLGAGEALDHPQTLHNGDAIERQCHDVGRLRMLGPLARFATTPSRPGEPAVSDAARASATNFRWQSPAASPAAPAPTASDRSRVLDGVLVLELATWIATPTASTLLAELGARVVKVEPLAGDPLRAYPMVHWNTTQGKESLTLDLKTPGGREILQRLATRADILLHNYRPGVPERLGMDYETLSALNPGLIYVYGASFGSTGPYSSKIAYHPTFGAICGGVLKQQGAPLPTSDAELTPETLRATSRALEHCNESNPDYNAGIASTTASLLALYHRARTGRGQYLETTMLCGNAYANSEDFVSYDGMPERIVPDPERLGLGPLYRLYRAAEGWIFLACVTPREFERLSDVLSQGAWLEDARFSDERTRRANAAALGAALETIFAEKTADAWEQELSSRGVACVRADCGPVGQFVLQEPFAREAGFVAEALDAEHGPYARYGPRIQLSRDSGEVWASNVAGAQNLAILSELGYSSGQIEELERAGAVGTAR